MIISVWKFTFLDTHSGFNCRRAFPRWALERMCLERDPLAGAILGGVMRVGLRRMVDWSNFSCWNTSKIHVKSKESTWFFHGFFEKKTHTSRPMSCMKIVLVTSTIKPPTWGWNGDIAINRRVEPAKMTWVSWAIAMGEVFQKNFSESVSTRF